MRTLLSALTAIFLCAASVAQQPEEITYNFEDFEQYTPSMWRGNPHVSGDVAEELGTVHGGSRAVALRWGFSGSEPDMRFANATFHRRMVGRVQDVRVWVHAEEAAVGARLTLWVSDASGETYIQRAVVDRPGWQQVSFRVAGVAPGWTSGDGNGQQDLPLSLFGIAVDSGSPEAGRLILDDVDVSSLATPREALGCSVTTDRERNLFWHEEPCLQVAVRNLSRIGVAGLHCALRVEDLYRETNVWTGALELPTVEGRGLVEADQQLPLPFGVYRVHWQLADDWGEVLSGSLDLAHMGAPCYRGAPASVKDYDRRWSIVGGVFGSVPPDLAGDTGARWIRYENTTWSGYETAPGQFDTSGLGAGLQPYLAAGIDAIILQTLYQRPDFRNPDQPSFAPAYGAAMRHTARGADGLAHCFELGNEDNGPTKMLYTEVARHGAAAIRSVAPQALVANSGTAFVDLSWLQMQADRGLYDWLDAVCTHPYTVNDSAEAWDVLGSLERVNDLIDTLGGMKLHWTTEFGWHHTFSQPSRARWIPRHFLIGAAAGLWRHGLYTWERDYGIFQGIALPPAASVQAMCAMLQGHRFVGLLQNDSRRWACVWERAGTPLVIAWSPAGDAEWTVDAGPEAKAFDLFGNPLDVAPAEGRLGLHLDGGPTYVTGLPVDVLHEAARNQGAKDHARLARCLQRAGLDTSDPWLRLSETALPEDLQAALRRWASGRGPVELPEQAVVAQALRCLLGAGRFGTGVLSPQREDLDRLRAQLRNRLAQSIADDVDIPSVRYLLECSDRLADEERMAVELGSVQYAVALRALEATVGEVCGRFLRDGQRVCFALWPYLYTEDDAGALQEALRFVPGETSVVTLRVHSYSSRRRVVRVQVEPPAGWSAEPATVEMAVDAGAEQISRVRLRCPETWVSERPEIRCTLRSDGLPDRCLTFDDTAVEAPVELSVEPSRGLLPATPLQARLVNKGSAPVGGLVRLMRKGDSRAIARAGFDGLAANSPQSLSLALRQWAPLPHHDWPLVVEMRLADGRRVVREVRVDFACAVRAIVAPVIDGDLADWRCATPLHLDRPEYAKGSFGGTWSPEDLSATVYAMWDEQHLYLAADVSDQTFNQQLSGTSQWIQDSLQFALAPGERGPRTELGLALTPQGEEVVSYTAPSPAVAGATLKVKLSQGKAVYEAAIPWGAFGGLEHPAAGADLRFSVLVNDDDAVTGRRFLERYGGIAHDKDTAKFGHLVLLAQSGDTVADPPEPAPVFFEDFEEYDPETVPDAWHSATNREPVPASLVQVGAGREASKALVLHNDAGLLPHVYRNLTRELEGVRPGRRYRLSCWMRTEGQVPDAGVIGVCSDLWGNEAFSYADNAGLETEWRQVSLDFDGPPGGRLKVIVRNMERMQMLAIDDIRVDSL